MLRQIFAASGSHFLAHTDRGCSDYEQKAQMVLDVYSKEQVLQIVIPLYRHDAKITKLFKLTKKEVDYYSIEHKLDEIAQYHR